MIEELPHRLGRGALSANVLEPGDVFGRQRVFEKEEFERFDILGELDGVAWTEAFVDVVQKLYFGADFSPNVLDHFGHPTDVFAWMVVGAVGSAFRFLDCVRRPTIAAHLNANMPVSLLHILANVLSHFLLLPSIRVCVGVCRFPAFPTQQLIDGHSRTFPLDVPECLIDSRDGVVEDRAVAPVAVDRGHLPRFLDPVDIPTDQEGFEMLLDSSVDSIEPLCKCGASQAVKPVVRCDNLDDDQPGTCRLREDRFNVFDGYWHLEPSGLGEAKVSVPVGPTPPLPRGQASPEFSPHLMRASV